MGLFKEIAQPLVVRGVPVVPLRPRTKIAFLSNWQQAATTDQIQIQKWDEEFPDANGACVSHAKIGGIWFLEIDRAGVVDQIELETGQKMPETLMIRSSPGRGHYYFQHTPASIAMGNAQAKDENGETWSARADNRYVVAPLSFHPNGGRYEIIQDVDIVPAPDWLVQWCANHKLEDEKQPITASIEGGKIPRGAHDTSLTRVAGKLRQDGLEEESIYNAIVEVCEKRCENYGSDYRDMCRKIAHSVCRYPVKELAPVMLGGVPVGQAHFQVSPDIVPTEIIKAIPYPIFPRWVMKGTSLYGGLVEPICAVNSRYPEFMFIPAVALILNYLAGKVRIEYKNHSLSFYMVSIGRKGRVIKSSSVKDAVEYLHNAGLVVDAGPHSRNAEGKSMIFTAGSPEGLGIEMTRTNCKNAVLFYDELSSLTNKAGIEGSSLTSKLLEMYESAKFANTVKSRKEQYNFEPGSYCTSLIACTTDTNFLQHWSKMAGGSSGLNERFFFLYQPEILTDLKPYTHVDTREAALETRKRVDKAVNQGVFHITDMTPLEMKINKLGNRTEIRAEKLALYFAIDLGRDEIDEECVARALAICDYELQAKRYLKTFESTNRESVVQNEIIQILQRNGGRIEKRELEKVAHPLRYGTSLYLQCYAGLLRAGYLAVQGTGVKNDPEIVVLMRNVEEEDE